MHSSLFSTRSLALRICCCLAIAWQPTLVRACLNDYEHRTPQPGTPAADAKTYIAKFRVHPELDPAETAAKGQRAKSGNYQAVSDYAVALLRQGDYGESLRHLKTLADEHGDEYVIAANLGTAYELNGDVPNALKWIRRGVELNPKSHNGSEWLHVKILEAKLQAQGDKAWFAKNQTLALDFGTAVQPTPPNTTLRDQQQNELSLDQVRQALEYQLHERTQFIKDENPQMSELLLALGNIWVLQGQPEKGYEVFKLAREYEPLSSPLLEAKIQTFNPMQGNLLQKLFWDLRQNLFQVVLFSLVAVTIIWFVVSNIRRKFATN